MKRMPDLTGVESHFEFGRNWRSFAASLSGPEIDDATEGLRKLLGIDTLARSSFLDIGCGSGIHTLAALRLGARSVVALDIDPDSVDTTQQLLARHADGHTAEVRVASIFKSETITHSSYDVVYSWGVLHHTGRMLEARSDPRSSCSPEASSRSLTARPGAVPFGASKSVGIGTR